MGTIVVRWNKDARLGKKKKIRGKRTGLGTPSQKR